MNANPRGVFFQYWLMLLAVAVFVTFGWWALIPAVIGILLIVAD